MIFGCKSVVQLLPDIVGLFKIVSGQDDSAIGQLGNGLHTFGTDKLKDLLDIRQKLGMDDKRAELKECELCDNSEFRPGVVCSVPGTPTGQNGRADPGPDTNPELEALVSKITGQIMDKLGN